MKKNLLTWKILLMVFFNLSAIHSFAQVSNYTFSQSTGTYTTITGGTVSATGSSLDDGIISVTLPAAFVYNGTSINTIGFSPNGYLILGAASLSNSPYVPISSTSAATGIISALGMDLVSSATTSEQRWQQIGNEIIFQWKQFKRYNLSAFTNEVVSFQIRLNTSTGVISMIYDGSTSVDSSIALVPQVGLRGSTMVDYNARRLTTTIPDTTPAWNHTAAAASNAHNVRFTSTSIAAYPSAGLAFVWTPIACAALPTSLSSNTITATTANIVWTAATPAPASGYEYYVSPSATVPTTTTTATGTTASGVVTKGLTGLLSSTTYYFWVRSNCNGTDKSSWVNGGSFTTACATISTFPWTETYETNSTTRSCWTNAYVSGTSNWSFAAGAGGGAITAAHGGTVNARFVSMSGNGTPVTKFISPVLNLTGVANPVLDFWYGQEERIGNYNELKVYYRTTSSGTWNQIAHFDQIANVWTEVKNLVLPNPSATYQIAFEGINYDGRANVLDDIVVKAGAPSITVTPTTAEICAGAAVTLTANSAASPAYNYTWTPSVSLNTNSGATVIATPAATTTYTVTGTNGTFTITKDVTITVKPTPAAINIDATEISAGIATCESDYVRLSVQVVPVNIVSEGFEGSTFLFEIAKDDLYTPNATANIISNYYSEGLKSARLISSGDIDGDYGFVVIRLINGLDLTNYSNAELTFDHIAATEPDFDYGAPVYSLNGIDWYYFPKTAYKGTGALLASEDFIAFDPTSYTDWSTRFVSQNILPSNTLWKSEKIDLSMFAGNSNVRIGFYYDFDEGVDYYGWLVDNVKINISPKISWSPQTQLYTDAGLVNQYVAGANSPTVYAAPTVPTSYIATSSLGTCEKSTNTGSFVRSQKTFSGSDVINPAHWSVPQNWSLNTVPTADKCVNIPAGRSVVVNIPDAVAKTVTVEAGGFLTINPNQALTVTDKFTNSNTSNLVPESFPKQYYVMIESDGNLLQTNKVTNVGDIAARREINIKNNQQYNYLISPLIGANLKTNIYEDQTTHVLSTSPFTLYHNEATNKFYTSSGAYIAGRGLAVKEPAAGTGTINVLFTGVPMNGSLPYTLVNTTLSDAVHGYNLIGNPYPSNLDLISFYNNNNSSGKLDPTFYFWDSTANSQTAQAGNTYGGEAYATFNVSTPPNLGTPVKATGDPGFAGTKEATRYVKVGQGFMARSLAASLPVNFENTQRVSNPATGFFGNEAKESVPFDRYWLNLISPTNLTSNIAVVYFEGGNDTYTKDDSRSLLGSDAIYTIVDNQPISINGKSSFVNTDVVTLGSKHFLTGNYTIQLDERKDGVFATGQNIYLKDIQTGIITNLSQGSYTFAANAGESTGRFEIIYKPETVLATDDKVKENVIVYRDGNDFVVKSASKKITALDLFDSAGRLILSLKPNAVKVKVSADQLVNGVYVLKIDQNGIITTKKVMR